MKKIVRIYLSILCLISLSCDAQEPTTTIIELDNKIEKLFNKSNLPGFSVVVVNDKRIIYQKSIGYADIESKKKFTNNSIQNIGSIYKTLIALAIMKAVEQGKINLDNNINNYLSFKVEHPLYPVITIRHLANHTSDINDGGFITNSTDFSKYLSEMINGYNGKVTLLTKESYKEMFTRKN